jgi:hypothetical protein
MPNRAPYVLTAATLLLVAGASDAALTTGSCLALKRQAWGNLRKCQAAEEAKQLKGRTADLAKCQTKFDEKLAKITEKATEEAIPCRYGDNGDRTVTDYDTGLQWEKKSPTLGLTGFCAIGDVHCVTDEYDDWDEAQAFASSSTFGLTPTTCYFGHCDWRLPAIDELMSIVDLNVAGCGITLPDVPCIDPIFGPTALGLYWSATTLSSNPEMSLQVHFGVGSSTANLRTNDGYYVRVVRRAF